jgi:hypothetical protein
LAPGVEKNLRELVPLDLSSRVVCAPNKIGFFTELAPMKRLFDVFYSSTKSKMIPQILRVSFFGFGKAA